MDRLALAVWIALGVAACGAAPPAQVSAPPPTIQAPAPPPTIQAPAPPSAGESVACRESRTAILAAMQASRESRACVTATDCAVVTGPGHHSPDYHQVVHAADAAALDARAREHLRTCGAFHHHEQIGVFTTVAARCVAARCEASETSYHIDE